MLSLHYYLLNLDRDYALNVQPCKLTKKKKKVGFQLEKHELMIKPVIYLLSK